MKSKITLEELIRETEALTYLNTLKAAISELKDELTTIDETREYQDAAIARARKIIRRIDNQYRAIVKASQGPIHNEEDVDEDIIKLMEQFEDE